MGRKRSRWGRRFLLSVLSTCIGLLSAEVAARLFLERPQSVRVSDKADYEARLREENRSRSEMRLPRGPGYGLYVDTKTGRRLRANTVAVVENHRLSKRDIVIRTNSIGYRNPEIGEKVRTRALFLGDSITFGDYVDEDETFVRLVERLSLDTGRPLETINAGVGAIGMENELAVLMETGLGTEPDIVVLDFYLNDAASSPGVEILHVPGFLAWSRLLQHLAHALPFVLSRSDERVSMSVGKTWMEETAREFPPTAGDPRREPGAFNRRIQETFRDWGSAWSDGPWERMEPILVEFERQSEIHGFQFVIVCFPVRDQVEAEFVYDHPQRRLAAIADDLGVPMLDLLPPLRDAFGRSDEPLFYDQCHPTPHGNRLIAEWIHRFLQENGT